jgi:hypothetical protein
VTGSSHTNGVQGILNQDGIIPRSGSDRWHAPGRHFRQRVRGYYCFFFTSSINGPNKSIGTGKTMVLVLSLAMPARVCR